MIAESILASVDDEGNSCVLLDEIVDHRKGPSALSKSEALIRTSSGIRKKVTTKGWELLISWKDGTQSWVRLADMKESFPVEVAKHAIGNEMSEEPAFIWWVHEVI